MDEPIRPRASVPRGHKPRMRCGKWRGHGWLPWGATWWLCSGSGHVADGRTMDEAYAEWERRVRARREARGPDPLGRADTFGEPMSQGDRHAAARMLERAAGGPW